MEKCGICKVEMPEDLLDRLVDSSSQQITLSCPGCALKVIRRHIQGFMFTAKEAVKKYNAYLKWIGEHDANTAKKT